MNKNKIKMLLKNNKKIYNIVSYIYVFLFDHKRLEKKRKYGNKNSDKSILLIRPNSEDGIQGLMSLFIQTIRWVEYANRKGMIPFIDFKNYKTQYSDGTNVWEYFFSQPSALTIEEVYESENVVISGTTLYPQVNDKLFRGEVFFDEKLCKNCYHAIWDNIKLNEKVENVVREENINIHVENCIGAYLRGTDYIRLKPSGEYVQPQIDEFIEKLGEFVRKYPEKNIFLVTEDDMYFTKIRECFGDKVKTVSFDSFIKNYNESTYLSKTGVLNKDKYKRGMDYLVKIVLLSRCEQFVGSITMGSIAAYTLNGGNYKEKYIFDLGLYQ